MRKCLQTVRLVSLARCSDSAVITEVFGGLTPSYIANTPLPYPPPHGEGSLVNRSAWNTTNCEEHFSSSCEEDALVH
jgi:hypothetical protein